MVTLYYILAGTTFYDVLTFSSGRDRLNVWCVVYHVENDLNHDNKDKKGQHLQQQQGEDSGKTAEPPPSRKKMKGIVRHTEAVDRIARGKNNLTSKDDSRKTPLPYITTTPLR